MAEEQGSDPTSSMRTGQGTWLPVPARLPAGHVAVGPHPPRSHAGLQNAPHAVAGPYHAHGPACGPCPGSLLPLLARTRQGTRGPEACSQAVGTHASLVPVHLSVSWLREASRTIRRTRMRRASVGCGTT